jgi:hypothetical protein
MAASHHLTLWFYFTQKQNRIITPVNLFSVPFNASQSLSTNALWDTGASMSAITPEIQNKLKVTPVDKKTILPIANFLLILFHTINLPVPFTKSVSAYQSRVKLPHIICSPLYIV